MKWIFYFPSVCVCACGVVQIFEYSNSTEIDTTLKNRDIRRPLIDGKRSKYVLNTVCFHFIFFIFLLFRTLWSQWDCTFALNRPDRIFKRSACRTVNKTMPNGRIKNRIPLDRMDGFGYTFRFVWIIRFRPTETQLLRFK